VVDIARSGRRGARGGLQRQDPPGTGGTGRVGAGSVGTDRDTTHHWDRLALTRWQLLIGPRGAFKFKFDR
jgi:hypothetical protein